MVTHARRGKFAPTGLLQSLLIAAAVLFGASCSDRSSPAAPDAAASGNATFSIAPSFQATAAAAPVVTLSKIVGMLIAPSGDKIVVEAKFVGDSAVLVFDVHVTRSSMPFTLDITAYDDQGIIAYHGSQQIIVRPGRNAGIKPPTLVYAAPDAKITTLKISNPSVSMGAGTVTSLSVTGTGQDGAQISPLRVGWTSSNPTIATVDDKGVVRAGSLQGTATITATLANNVAATTTIKVQAPVSKLTLTPGTAEIIRGKTAPLVADLRDVGNNVIDDRSPTWSSSDESVATVSATGVVTGVKIGKAKITATTEGKTASTDITVVTPIDHIEASPVAIALASIGANDKITVVLAPKPGAATTGIVPTFTSSDSTIVKVDDKGTLTAVSNGTATITVTADDKTATAIVTVKQVAVSITIDPPVASIDALGTSVNFGAKLLDALKVPINSPSVVWTSSDPTIATVTQAGVAKALRAGTVTITATANGISTSATLIISPVVRGFLLFTSKAQINVGSTATLAARFVDANGNALGDAPALLSTTTPSIASLSGNVLTGLSAGTAHVVATIGTQTASIDVQVIGQTGGGGGGLTLHVLPATAEKLPNGTQLFSVQEDVAVSWTVNGVPGGNATYGTIDSRGFYRAPGAQPSPSSFDVCAISTSPAGQGCARVTINPIPTSGADVIVVNDINSFDTNGPDNVRFYQNLVNFTGAGPRASGTKVVFYLGNVGQTSIYNYPVNQTIVDAGYSTSEMRTDINAPIDPQVKLLFLELPNSNFSNTQINYLKSFSAQGGRIVFVGEHAGYYNGIPVENAFLASMGAQMTNAGGAFDCGRVTEPLSALRPHQITTGLSSLDVGCMSELIPGPNDYAILYTSIDGPGQHVLIGAAKVDVTPLQTSGNLSPARAWLKAAQDEAIRANVARGAAARVRATGGTPTQPWKDPLNPPSTANRGLVKPKPPY